MLLVKEKTTPQLMSARIITICVIPAPDMFLWHYSEHCVFSGQCVMLLRVSIGMGGPVLTVSMSVPDASRIVCS